MENNELVTDQLLSQDQTANEETVPEKILSETESKEQAPTEEPVIPEDLLTEEEAKEVEKEMTEIEKLIAKRTGFWEVSMDLEDVKWIKNACQGKFEFTGPNEAYFLITCYMGFAGALQRAQSQTADERDRGEKPKVILQAAAIEACGMFINRFKGSTLEAAQRLFRIAMAMNNVILDLRDLDAKIEAMRQAEKIVKEQGQPSGGVPEDLGPQPEQEKPVDYIEPGT